MKKKLLIPIFLIVFIDLLGFSLIIPLLPYYAREFGANGTTIGLLLASYAAAQLIGAPILGRLSDRFGRRPVLLISIGGTMIGFLIFGFANSLIMLFASRILQGLFGGNLSVAQAYITDVTDAKSRSKGLGLIGAAFGLGFIIGPALGGILSQYGYNIPAFLAAGLAAINLVLVAMWLPESLTPERRSHIPAKKVDFFIGALTRTLKRPLTGPLLITRFVFSLAFAILQTIFALYALERFSLEAEATGFILTYVGILSVFTQGYLVGRLANKIRDDRIIIVSILIMAFSLAGWAITPSIPVLLVVLAPIAIAGGILNTVLTSALTKTVQPHEVGGILGLSTSLESATRVIAPLLGGLFLDKLGFWAPGAFSALLLAGLVIYTWQILYDQLIYSEITQVAKPVMGE